LARHLEGHLGGVVEPSGSVRTMEEWVRSVALIVGIADVPTGRVFLESTAVARFLGYGESGESILVSHEGVEVRAHLVTPELTGAMQLIVTGPPDHARSILDATDGVTGPESRFYAASGRVWIPAPARGLPNEMAEGVIRVAQIRGDLHLHSDLSPDGRMSLDEILLEAVDRGYEYVLITDHTSGLRFGGLDESGLDAQAIAIEALRANFPDLVVLHGAELNIARDGSLDIDEGALDRLDLAVAGLHSFFDLDRSEQTARVTRALDHPVVRVLAHPTGRRIGARPGIDVDIDSVIASAITHDVALEVNGHRDRLDLSASQAATAVAAGALLAANSDAHRIGEMGNIANAVATMQRAGVAPEAVVNSWPADRFISWVRRTAPAGVSDATATGS
jgi:DNA polymerase (family 10)